MTEKKEFQVNKNTPFWDASLTDQERIDWLLKEMTVEEKLGYLASSSPDLPRLGIPGVSVGGEAAHGVEGRNDQNGLGKPDVTTSFPQPIGMSASWDPELIRQAGEITGTEARVVWHRHEGHGLSRWAPTVDLVICRHNALCAAILNTSAKWLQIQLIFVPRVNGRIFPSAADLRVVSIEML